MPEHVISAVESSHDGFAAADMGERTERPEDMSIVIIHDAPFFQIVQEGDEFVGEIFTQAMSLSDVNNTAAQYGLVVRDMWFEADGFLSASFRLAGEGWPKE